MYLFKKYGLNKKINSFAEQTAAKTPVS